MLSHVTVLAKLRLSCPSPLPLSPIHDDARSDSRQQCFAWNWRGWPYKTASPEATLLTAQGQGPHWAETFNRVLSIPPSSLEDLHRGWTRQAGRLLCSVGHQFLLYTVRSSVHRVHAIHRNAWVHCIFSSWQSYHTTTSRLCHYPRIFFGIVPNGFTTRCAVWWGWMLRR